MPLRGTDAVRCVGVLAAALAIATPGSAQTEQFDTVLTRAGAYVLTFVHHLAGIVAEETYVQVVHAPIRFSRRGPIAELNDSRRELKSDLLLVHADGPDAWIQFRDVFEVDGRPVRDRNDRLVKLFLQPAKSTSAQLEKIVSESTRYNIGNITRTVNMPVLALTALEPGNQPRFKFERAPTDELFTLSTEVCVIQYDEVRPHTIIRTTAGRDLPMHGRFWIESSTGRVLKSELIAEDSVVRGKIDVSYQSEPVAGLSVPIEMREEYLAHTDSLRIEGTATYKNSRRFQVKVDEKIGPIKDKSDR